MPERLRAWSLTAQAAIMLLIALCLIRLSPLRTWRGSLGLTHGEDDLAMARRLAGHLERAAARLPLASRCLPRAMALSWMLRITRLRHAVVLAVRPASERKGVDDLHAWVEAAGMRVLGDLPGPWREVARLGSQSGA